MNYEFRLSNRLNFGIHTFCDSINRMDRIPCESGPMIILCILSILSEIINVLLLGRPAHEVRGGGEAADSQVFGDLREGEKRPRANDLARGIALLGHQLVWRLAFLDPAQDGVVKSDGRGSRTTKAVVHTGDQEQPRELRRLLWPAHLLLDPLVILDAAGGRDELVRQAVNGSYDHVLLG